MARLARVEIFSPDEIALVHVMNRMVRRCFLMGNDPLTGKNFDHRKLWLEIELKRLAAQFGIDLLCHAILSNHFHLVLRSRPDVVAQTLEQSEYVELLDWTARTIRSDKCGSTPVSAQPVFERLGISGEVWCALVRDFGRLFYAVAGQPHAIDACRSRRGQRRYKTKHQTRELLAASS